MTNVVTLNNIQTLAAPGDPSYIVLVNAITGAETRMDIYNINNASIGGTTPDGKRLIYYGIMVIDPNPPFVEE